MHYLISRDKLPGLRDSFFSGAWAWMQNRDSNIAERVMIKLLDNEPSITALPIHDSFVVRRGAEQLLINAMQDAFNEVTGTQVEVKRDIAIFDRLENAEAEGLVHAQTLHGGAQGRIRDVQGLLEARGRMETRNGSDRL